MEGDRGWVGKPSLGRRQWGTDVTEEGEPAARISVAMAFQTAGSKCKGPEAGWMSPANVNALTCRNKESGLRLQVLETPRGCFRQDPAPA